ncbi:response regulator transcription factor [Peristeroidobacter soli]|jgi:DNA-binding response OmpR family regulator|uniref:response regulator transcription factor n=1 Tax=Peristeroidobacter soli TaxID=2497877 RepID=UPI00101CE067|nr:response regulator transcription factor [Peristeroidobacter soli]
MDPHLNIAVVEDHEALRIVTVEALQSRGHRVTGVESAESLQEMLGNQPLELVVVDVNLPGEDGVSLARRLKQSHPDLGVIVVSAGTRLDDKLDAYECGADIYLTKPIAVEELCAAAGALGKRIQRTSHPPPSGFSLDLKRMRLRGPAGEISLTSQDATLLAALVRAPGRRLETWQLLEQLGWLETGKIALEVPVSRLRRKFSVVGATANPLIAIRKQGYQLSCDVVIA